PTSAPAVTASIACRRGHLPIASVSTTLHGATSTPWRTRSSARPSRLPVGVPQVDAHGRVVEAELVGDLLAGQARVQQRDDLPLSRGEQVVVGGGNAARRPLAGAGAVSRWSIGMAKVEASMCQPPRPRTARAKPASYTLVVLRPSARA